MAGLKAPEFTESQLENRLREAAEAAYLEVEDKIDLDDIEEQAMASSYEAFSKLFVGKKQVFDITELLEEPMKSKFDGYVERKEKKKRTISEAEVLNFKKIIDEWETVQKMKNELSRQFPTQKKGNRLYNITWGRNDDMGRLIDAYQLIVSPEKGKKDRLLTKRAAPGAEQLEEIVENLQDLQKLNEVLRLIDEIRKLHEKKAEAEAGIEKIEGLAETINTTRAEIRKALEIAADEESEDYLFSLMGERDQIEEHFATCFVPEFLERDSFDTVYQRMREKGDPKGFVLNSALLPNVTVGNMSKELKKVWDRDVQKLERLKKAEAVKRRMQQLEESILGTEKLEDMATPHTLDETKTREVTWGKFMEKIMSLVMAEHWKGKGEVKVIPVSDYIDLHAGVDLMLDIKDENGEHSLLGIDFTIQKEGGETTDKRTNDTSGLISPKETDLLENFPELIDPERREKTFSVKRMVLYNPAGMDFQHELARRIYEALEDEESKLPSVKEIYGNVRGDFEDKKTEQAIPKSLGDLVESVRSGAA
jgi:hypothetical protein